MGLRLIAEHPDQLPKLVLQAGYRVFEGQAQIEGNLIYPRVVGSSIGLPAVWTLFAVVFWGGLLGIPGILIGTPATAVLYRLLRTSVRTRLRERQIDPADPRLVEPAPLEEPEKTE